MSTKNLNERGVTLVEVMTAVAVFTMTTVGILNLCTSNVAMGKRSDMTYIAYNLAKNHIESLRAMNFSDLSSSAEEDVRLDEFGVADIEGKFVRSTAVVAPYVSDANLTQLTVSVSYFIKGEERSSPTIISSVVSGNG